MGILGRGRNRKARSSWMYKELQRVGTEEAGETWSGADRHQPWEGFILWVRRGSQGFIWSRGMAESIWSSGGRLDSFVETSWGFRGVMGSWGGDTLCTVLQQAVGNHLAVSTSLRKRQVPLLWGHARLSVMKEDNVWKVVGGRVREKGGEVEGKRTGTELVSNSV